MVHTVHAVYIVLIVHIAHIVHTVHTVHAGHILHTVHVAYLIHIVHIVQDLHNVTLQLHYRFPHLDFVYLGCIYATIPESESILQECSLRYTSDIVLSALLFCSRVACILLAGCWQRARWAAHKGKHDDMMT